MSRPDNEPRAGITRRRLLIGGGALAVGGAASAAVVVAGPRRVYDELTGRCDAGSADVPPPSDMRVTEHTLRSRFARSSVPYLIAAPSGGAESILFALPGRGSPPGSLLEALHLHDVVAREVERAQAPPMAVCAVGGGFYSYWHGRADGTDTLRMLVEEVVPRAREQLAIERPDNAIFGVSMGGYGALNAAARNPAMFPIAVGASPALWRSRPEQASAVPEAFMSDAEFRDNDLIANARGLDRVHVRIDCGDGDPFAPAVRALRASLPDRPAGAISPGCHEGSFWRRVAPAQAAFVVGHMRSRQAGKG